MLNFLLGVYVGINIVGVLIVVYLVTRENVWGALLYPALDDALDYNLSRTERKLIKIGFTVLFLPVVAMYFIVFTMLLVIYSIMLLVEHFINNIILKEK